MSPVAVAELEADYLVASVDAASRSLGGLTHHVVHPGGLSYATFPVNANEAEARRRSRFAAQGHTAGGMTRPVAETSPEHPCTLDLRAHA